MTGPIIEWVTPGRAALLLRVSTKSITRFADSGKLRFTWTEGGHRRVALADVRAMIAKRAADAAELEAS